MVILFLFSVFVCFERSDLLEEGGNGVEEDSPVSALEDISKTSPQTIPEDVSNGRSRQRQKVDKGLTGGLLCLNELLSG